MPDIVNPGEFEKLEPNYLAIFEDRVDLRENRGSEQCPRLIRTLQHIRFETRRFGPKRADDIVQSI